MLDAIVEHTKSRDTVKSITGYNAKTKQSMYFYAADWQEAKTLLEKREGMSEFVRTAIKNEIERRKKEKREG